VLNLTPDSFSDGGAHNELTAGIEHGFALAAQGADIVDIGGESTRPGAERVTSQEEAQRTLAAVSVLAEAGICVSIDTMRAEIAVQAVDRGACLINDVSGGLADPAMLAAVKDCGAIYVCGHWRTNSAQMDQADHYIDPVAEVITELSQQIDRALAVGIAHDQLVVDPGLGFSKANQANWELLGALSKLAELGFPMLIGASRKRFLGTALADSAGQPRPLEQREAATTAVSALAAAAGVWAVRVHQVPNTADAVKIASYWRAATIK
jgi:dihydropteroate synthase